MPAYDLKCKGCDLAFEKFTLGIITEEEKICPECGSRNVVMEFKKAPTVISDSACGGSGNSGFG